MRSNHTLDAIISPTRQAVLATLYLRPEKSWYLSELAASLETSPSSLQRSVDALVNVGVLERRVDGRRSYIKANESSPIFPELRGLFEKTSGIVPMVRDAMVDTEGVRLAFIYGSIARGEERAGSDVDVLIVGSASSLVLNTKLRQVEGAIGRAVNTTVFSVEDFRESFAREKHFLMTVLRGKKIMLVGNEDELESVARGAEGASASVEQAGTR